MSCGVSSDPHLRALADVPANSVPDPPSNTMPTFGVIIWVLLDNIYVILAQCLLCEYRANTAPPKQALNSYLAQFLRASPSECRWVPTYGCQMAILYGQRVGMVFDRTLTLSIALASTAVW